MRRICGIPAYFVTDGDGSVGSMRDDWSAARAVRLGRKSLIVTGFCVPKPKGSGNAGPDISAIPRYTRITRHSCRHRRSCREGGDPVRYGLR
jgi:hypothetical protein